MDLFTYLLAKNNKFSLVHKADLFSYLLGKKSRLPSEYQEIEYLESTGTQYINTGIIATIYSGLKIKYRYTESGSASISGIFQNRSPRTDTLFISSSSGQTSSIILLVHRGYTDRIATINIELNTDYVAKVNYLNDGKMYVNGIHCFNVGRNNVYNAEIPIFGRFNPNDSSMSISNSRIYYAEFTEDNVVTHKFIPCRRLSDDVLGMYDIITDTFFTNAGSGTFIAGPNVK